MRTLFILAFSLTFSGFIAADRIDDALAHTHRSEADRKADVHRHPKAVISFGEFKEGHKVLDIFAGGGYYSEILAHTVGPRGKITAYNNQPYLKWIGDQLTARLENKSLPNIESLVAEVAELNLPASHYDRMIASMAFHDLYYADPANQWPEIDAAKFYRALFNSLKSGGYLIVIDHSAKDGSGVSSTQSLHRIEESFLVNDLLKAGFILEASSDALRNTQDTRDLSSFEPRVRFQTDRFLLRLKKP